MQNENSKKKILVTGGLGFIGSHFVEMALERGYEVINVDKRTYAAREDLEFDKRNNYKLIEKDICDIKNLPEGITFIVNFAAESHVENSIADNSPFIRSNVTGVYNLLELVRKTEENKRPIFFQISTDEVYGDILEGAFTENDKLSPSNPYSATKAAAEQLVIGWGRTYGIKYRISRSCNNYGYGQRAEKLIPKAMKLALKGIKMTVQGTGQYKREWISAEDNCEALFAIMNKGKDGEIYNISTGIELTNLEIIKKVLKVMGRPDDFYEFVADRPGQDVRYAIAFDKIKALGWSPKTTLDDWLPLCKKQNEDRKKMLPPGKKQRILQLMGMRK